MTPETEIDVSINIAKLSFWSRLRGALHMLTGKSFKLTKVTCDPPISVPGQVERLRDVIKIQEDNAAANRITIASLKRDLEDQKKLQGIAKIYQEASLDACERRANSLEISLFKAEALLVRARARSRDSKWCAEIDAALKCEKAEP